MRYLDQLEIIQALTYSTVGWSYLIGKIWTNPNVGLKMKLKIYS